MHQRRKNANSPFGPKDLLTVVLDDLEIDKQSLFPCTYLIQTVHSQCGFFSVKESGLCYHIALYKMTSIIMQTHFHTYQ